MPKARWPHPVILYEEDEQLWQQFKTDHPDVSFSGLCRDLLKRHMEAVCVVSASS